MSNTITLPDNISFEEIALEWLKKDWRMIQNIGTHYFYTIKLKKINSSELDYKRVGYHSSKSKPNYVFIEDEGGFSDVINFIKERSNV